MTARAKRTRRPRKPTICEKAGCTYRSGERRCVVCGSARPLEPGDPRVRVLSLGGGLDSFAVLVRSIQLGEPPDAVVFVDVGHPGVPGEWPGTYRHVREVVAPLCERHEIQFVWIDSQMYPVRDAPSLLEWLEDRRQIPVAGPTRVCTRVAKVERFERWMHASYPGQDVEVWIGFESGEEKRAAYDPNAGRRQSRLRPVQAARHNRYPLIEWGLCRCRCEQLVRAAGYPVPRKSACVFCLAGETEVVTRQGVRPIRELSGGRHELLVPQVCKRGGLQHRGSFKEVEIRSFGPQKLWEVQLRRMKSVRTIRATAEHRWFLTAGPQWSEASNYEILTQDLKPGDKLRTLRVTPPTKEHRMNVAVAQGFTFGDGSHGLSREDHRPASVTLYGAKDEALLPYFPGVEARRVLANGKRALRIYGLPRSWKQHPPLDESRAFLLSWLAGYFAADGSVSKAGQATLESASLEALRLARDVAAVCGVGYTKIGTRMRRGKLERPGPLHRFSLRLADLPEWFFIIHKHRDRVAALQRSPHDPPWVVTSIRPLNVTEEVYCAVVPGAQAFGLSEDLMTGNCPYASRADWRTLAAEAPEVFERIAQLEEQKPLTKRGKKLTIMAYDSDTQTGTPLRVYVQSEGRPRPPPPCKVCGAARRATKATGCGYLDDAPDALATAA